MQIFLFANRGEASGGSFDARLGRNKLGHAEDVREIRPLPAARNDHVAFRHAVGGPRLVCDAEQVVCYDLVNAR